MSGFLTTEDLRAITAESEAKAPIGSQWRHRNGCLYEILGIGIAEGDQRPVVIYRPVGIDVPPWLRSADEFFDGRFSKEKTS